MRPPADTKRWAGRTIKPAVWHDKRAGADRWQRWLDNGHIAVKVAGEFATCPSGDCEAVLEHIGRGHRGWFDVAWLSHGRSFSEAILFFDLLLSASIRRHDAFSMIRKSMR
jgi:hypothetical protein